MRLAMILAVALAVPAPAPAAEPVRRDVEFTSDPIGGLGLPMAESAKPAHRLSLTAKVDAQGEGTGALVLDPTEPAHDEFGFPAAGTPVPPVKLDCTLKFV